MRIPRIIGLVALFFALVPAALAQSSVSVSVDVDGPATMTLTDLHTTADGLEVVVRFDRPVRAGAFAQLARNLRLRVGGEVLRPAGRQTVETTEGVVGFAVSFAAPSGGGGSADVLWLALGDGSQGALAIGG
jgi:hypothetical protein